MKFSDFIKDCENDNEVDLTHFIYCTKEEILADYCFPRYKKDSLRLFFSMTKSITSLAIGIAVDMKLISLDTPIISFFTDELPVTPHKNLEKIQIIHLLTMSCGIHENTYTSLFVQDNWIKAFLAQDFPHEPGTYYRYSTHASHMLSAIISKVSGLSLKDFLNQYLFYPMDIFEAQFECSPEGVTAGGMGLSLYPISLAKIAQMLLNYGVYNGKRLLSSDYINDASISHIIKQDEIYNYEKIYSGLQYGFQFHICKDNHYRADGAFGQLCLVCPTKNMAFIAFSQKSKVENLLLLIYMYFIDNSNPILIDNYQSKIQETTLSIVFDIPNKIYSMERNILSIEYIEFISVDCKYQMKFVTTKGRADYIDFDFSCETQGKTFFVKDLQEHLQEYICIAKCNSENIIELNIYFIETPYIVKIIVSFENKMIQFDFQINVSFILDNFSCKGFLYELK